MGTGAGRELEHRELACSVLAAGLSGPICEMTRQALRPLPLEGKRTLPQMPPAHLLLESGPPRPWWWAAVLPRPPSLRLPEPWSQALPSWPVTHPSCLQLRPPPPATQLTSNLDPPPTPHHSSEEGGCWERWREADPRERKRLGETSEPRPTHTKINTSPAKGPTSGHEASLGSPAKRWAATSMPLGGPRASPRSPHPMQPLCPMPAPFPSCARNWPSSGHLPSSHAHQLCTAMIVPTAPFAGPGRPPGPCLQPHPPPSSWLPGQSVPCSQSTSYSPQLPTASPSRKASAACFLSLPPE